MEQRRNVEVKVVLRELRLSQRQMVELGLVLARHVMPIWQQEEHFSKQRPEEALQAVEAWLRDEATLQQVQDACALMTGFIGDMNRLAMGRPPATAVKYSAYAAADAAYALIALSAIIGSKDDESAFEALCDVTLSTIVAKAAATALAEHQVFESQAAQESRAAATRADVIGIIHDHFVSSTLA